MVQRTPRGYPYPEGGDSVSPQSRDFIELAQAIDADVALLAATTSGQIVLTENDDVDTLEPGEYLVSNVVIARALDLPWEYPSVISVKSISTGSGVVYLAQTAEDPSRMFTRRRLNNGAISDWAEVALESEIDEGGDSSGPVRRDLLQQGLKARKGGTIGTAGKGVIALRFDDAPEEFRTTILPLLVERNLPFTRVTTSEFIGNTPVPESEFPIMQTYSLNFGGEVWNHGTDHSNASGNAAIYNNLIGSLDFLRTQMPRIPIDCFAPPGGGGISYDGHMPSTSISNYADTFAGQTLVGHHAIVSGYFPNSYYKTLDGVMRDGQIHYSVDNYDLARGQQLVQRARDWKMGVCLMWHSNNIGAEGNMTLADFTALLDYIVAARDLGTVVVLTKSGMAVADARSDQRDDILTTHSGTTFSETLTYPQYRENCNGSTRELLATVTGSSGDTVTSTIGEFTKTHTIPPSGTLNLRHVVTIPLDTEALTVSIDANTANARLLAV